MLRNYYSKKPPPNSGGLLCAKPESLSLAEAVFRLLHIHRLAEAFLKLFLLMRFRKKVSV